jgi:hypothetical protein
MINAYRQRTRLPANANWDDEMIYQARHQFMHGIFS